MSDLKLYWPSYLADLGDGVPVHIHTYDSEMSMQQAMDVIQDARQNSKVYCAWIDNDEGKPVWFENYTDIMGRVKEPKEEEHGV